MLIGRNRYWQFHVLFLQLLMFTNVTSIQNAFNCVDVNCVDVNHGNATSRHRYRDIVVSFCRIMCLVGLRTSAQFGIQGITKTIPHEVHTQHNE
jgi:hypothetical protein